MKNVVFFDGKFVSQEDATVPITTHALHYGTGCFEGIRAYYSKKENALLVFRLEDHYKRLLRSCKILFIRIPHTLQELCDITKKLLSKNFEPTDLYIRPLAFKSDSGVGKFNLKTLADSFAIYTVPFGRHENATKGVRAQVSSWERISDNAIPPRAKITGSYINTVLAKTESVLAGFDEAIFLNKEGHVVEGSVENIFLMRDGKVITPPVTDDILEGITRDTIMQLCKNELNLPVEERSVDRSELYTADEVFLVGTAVEISSVVEIDGRKIGDGNIGSLTKQLQKFYDQIVHGEIPKYTSLLTKVTK